MRSIIISDIHLGSLVCQAKKFKDFLRAIHEEEIYADELVVNGDLFDSWDFRRLKESHWKILLKMRQIAKSKKIVWIRGNHDGSSEMISHLIGLDFLDEYIFDSGGKKVLALHGDVFDDFISENPILTKIADQAYRVLQKIGLGSNLALMAKRSSKTYLRCSEHVKSRAKSYAESKSVDIVCCGHTHMNESDLKDNVEYHNSGCWTENACHYILIANGKASVIKF
jgi:UDP-2,3-diacylglucosamine pyrophosphatase LpxH